MDLHKYEHMYWKRQDGIGRCYTYSARDALRLLTFYLLITYYVKLMHNMTSTFKISYKQT